MTTGSAGSDLDRYARLTELGWDIGLLRRSKIMVVGAGALGNEIIKNLASAGVGNLLIIDSDIIETHNLTRSVLFRGSDLGSKKAAVAARAALDIEPNLNARWFDGRVQHTVGLGVFRDVDVVLGGVGNLQTRRDLNASCMRTGTPFIDGGLFFLDGDVRIFVDPFPVCFDCTLTEDEREDGRRRWSCLGLAGDSSPASGPTAPTVGSMVGGLQAQLALKYLQRDRTAPYNVRVPNGVRIRFNGFADEYESWDLSRDPECPTHLTAERIPESSIRAIPHGNDVSAQLLLDEVQREFGRDCYIDIGFDLVHELRCTNCGSSDSCLIRQGSVTVIDSMCPRCTEQGCRACGMPLVESARAQPDLVFPDRIDCNSCFEPNELVIRQTQTLNRIEPESPALAFSLSELTVPLLDILEVKGIGGDESLYLQLEGDRERVFGHAPAGAFDDQSPSIIPRHAGR